ncbi:MULTISPECIES: phosphoribosylaminoimidazolesuccinocarboxamide synthase [unclassified Oceanobacillus]|uniref:phosphoribosylaminoimidazolesuccinocarboxamide synthase n=1 Tax=unclassified Oceanobacillus TaxID=2630292 RepID=UPI001BE58892|nr:MULTISPECIES: phosphoribosylaminoimidazolesuccinocarboxamide synthase [unclassified Oceanobacillus]MBT2600566.1 phosphoribosylaminoimidazolesuccinocarboxamide synthase [Oceanobacillus sp. ISL-74]MBT2651037.1 phosphoribosylaminoimidazolesuccinocarboxamide synthase [Oceanobacillus sp. ISL-73]
MKAALLYEGKAKKVYQSSEDEHQLVLSYKNDATAFNGEKKSQFEGKGRLNNEISSLIFQRLHEVGIKTHFIKRLDSTQQIVQKTNIIPLEVVIRNLSTGSITKRLGIKERLAFTPPLLELFYKDDALGDPLINDEHALLLTDITETELAEIKDKAREVNGALQEIFQSIGISLVDFKLEFGRNKEGEILLSDEVSPDTCRLWDIETNEKLDKDVFRQGMGDLITVYQEILNRLEVHV